jgi:hypothetical protein
MAAPRNLSVLSSRTRGQDRIGAQPDNIFDIGEDSP